MSNNQFNNLPKRNSGSFSVSDNKLRIQNSTGQSSVLFEDISSITWKQISIPNLIFIVIGVSIFFFGIMFFSNSSNEGNSFFYLFLLLGVGFCVYGYMNKIIWEDVIVETRGGMLLSYSVDEHQGQIEVDRIESLRRASINI